MSMSMGRCQYGAVQKDLRMFANSMMDFVGGDTSLEDVSRAALEISQGVSNKDVPSVERALDHLSTKIYQSPTDNHNAKLKYLILSSISHNPERYMEMKHQLQQCSPENQQLSLSLIFPSLSHHAHPKHILSLLSVVTHPSPMFHSEITPYVYRSAYHHSEWEYIATMYRQCTDISLESHCYACEAFYSLKRWREFENAFLRIQENLDRSWYSYRVQELAIILYSKQNKWREAYQIFITIRSHFVTLPRQKVYNHLIVCLSLARAKRQLNNVLKFMLKHNCTPILSQFALVHFRSIAYQDKRLCKLLSKCSSEHV